ncbi:hypothetical protein WMY93_026358 [Mugilogobius chulae]|uniref:Reverse transcriptase domain-containing protein n=1 Tax=Mugilogobius chulae TaxID=88201 RepID=A0AAW0N9Q6_9GOBI
MSPLEVLWANHRNTGEGGYPPDDPNEACRKKCLKAVAQGSRIDQYFLRSRSDQSSEVQQQEKTHSLQNISIPSTEQEEVQLNTEGNVEANRSQSATEKKIQGRRPLVKWPKSHEKSKWDIVNQDLCGLLEQLKGPAVKKLEKMGEIIYKYGAEHFGTAYKIRNPSTTQTKSRRQQEIEQLVKARRQLKKQWRKASEEEKDGINVLQAEIKNRLSILRRAEHLRRKRRKKEQVRTRFFNDPFRFLKSLFTKEKSGKLVTSKEELEAHLKEIHSGIHRNNPISLPSDMPPVPSPHYQFDISPPKWNEVLATARHARAASSPGPNGVPYRVYKNAPGVLRVLWKLMRVVWQKEEIPTVWRRAGGVLIPKEKDSTTIDQFRHISLLNVEGKIFFTILARRLALFLEKNEYIDTTVQKAGISGFSGCLEHTSMIWHQIQKAKRESKDLHVVFLDLANAFGSVPHKIIWTALNYFNVPRTITTLIQSFFRDIQLCLTTEQYTTAWQSLEVGIMAGCTISPLAFTMAMEIIIRASRWVVGGVRTSEGLRLPPIRAYMDDLTTLTSTKACTRRLLAKLQENIKWAQMEIKPSKSRSVSIVKGKLDQCRFYIGEDPIPTVTERPVKSLGRWYDASLKDSVQIDQIKEDTNNGLKTIDKTLLPGRFKLWCLQFGLLPRLMWPLTIYDIPLYKVEKLERMISSYAKKWLGLPRCITNSALYGRGILELPLTSLQEEFKCAKVRLEMTLAESRDTIVAQTVPTLSAGRKWSPAEAAAQAKTALRHQDIVGYVQMGRQGFGAGDVRPSWKKANPSQRRTMVVDEVRRQEEVLRHTKAVSQGKQGQWVRWEDVEKRKLSWKELWGMEAYKASFLIRSIYDVLPTPSNRQQWYGEDPTCALCPSAASLKHILVGCKTSLSQGRFTWRHNQVLKCLAASLEAKRTAINTLPYVPGKHLSPVVFLQAGVMEKVRDASREHYGLLSEARDWNMIVDLNQRLIFPAEIVSTNLRPDLVLWSPSLRKVLIVELTVPWEDSVDEAYERKSLKYSDLAAEAEQRGWKARVYPVEVGCRGFVSRSTIKLLKDLGIRGKALQQTLKSLSGAAEDASRWLWIKRRDGNWACKQ